MQIWCQGSNHCLNLHSGPIVNKVTWQNIGKTNVELTRKRQTTGWRITVDKGHMDLYMWIHPDAVLISAEVMERRWPGGADAVRMHPPEEPHVITWAFVTFAVNATSIPSKIKESPNESIITETGTLDWNLVSKHLKTSQDQDHLW